MNRILRFLQNRLGVPQTGNFDQPTAKAIMFKYQLSPEEAAHFLGQLSHETMRFRAFSENLNYKSPERIISVFKRHFPGGIEEARNFVRSPEKLANRVYSNRMGNGSESSGDGWRFRGRGAIHLTGRSNYINFANWMNEPNILNNPDLVSDEYALDCGYYFFEHNKLFNLCKKVDASTILSISRGVNIGNPNSRITPHGLEDRVNQTNLIYRWLKS